MRYLPRTIQEAGMARLIKRYGGGSRKLYDTEESRYVSLDELAGGSARGRTYGARQRKRDDVTRQCSPR
jgi:polyhydroxyalkanoate synthesis regulator protein